MGKPFSFKARLKSFSYAYSGIKKAIQTEHNLRIHLVLAGFAVFLGFFLKITFFEWSVILICIGAVIASEIFNSAIENMVNLISPEIQPLAGRAKDMAAGAVLVFSAMAFLVGILIFAPKLYHLLIQ